MIPTPRQPYKRYGLGAVNYHTGETVVLFRRRKRRREVAQLLEALVDKHPTGTIFVAWDNSNTHEDDEVEEVVRAAAGRLVLLYLPTYSPWLNPIEMLWRHFRRDVRSPTVSYSNQSRHFWLQLKISLIVTIVALKRFFQSLAHMQHYQCDCT